MIKSPFQLVGFIKVFCFFYFYIEFIQNVIFSTSCHGDDYALAFANFKILKPPLKTIMEITIPITRSGIFEPVK